MGEVEQVIRYIKISYSNKILFFWHSAEESSEAIKNILN
jgi:hypothetical protein